MLISSTNGQSRLETDTLVKYLLSFLKMMFLGINKSYHFKQCAKQFKKDVKRFRNIPLKSLSRESKSDGAIVVVDLFLFLCLHFAGVDGKYYRYIVVD